MKKYFKIDLMNFEFSNSDFEFNKVLAESSNGRTTPFGGVCRGSNPLSAA